MSHLVPQERLSRNLGSHPPSTSRAARRLPQPARAELFCDIAVALPGALTGLAVAGRLLVAVLPQVVHYS